MTKFLLISFMAVLALSLQSCKEDITINTEYKETPIIYGLLNQGEDLQFIKINRGFIGPGNALDIAKIPDSSYFENVSAKVEELVNNQVVWTYTLRDTIIATKNTNGIFYAPTQKVYYFSTNTHPLDETKNYRLTVDINEGKLTVVGETKLVRNFGETSLTSTNSSIQFAKNAGEYISSSIICDAGTAVFGNVSMDIHIHEFRGGNDSTLIKIPWNIAETATTNSKITGIAQGRTFFEKIRDGITNDNTITKRNLTGLEVTFTGGTQELYNYYLVNKPSTSLTQSKPTYTNLTVTEGHTVVGIFSARKTRVIYKPFVLSDPQQQQFQFIRCIDANTTRELCKGLIPGFPAQFCSQHPGDQLKDYKCQ